MQLLSDLSNEKELLKNTNIWKICIRGKELEEVEEFCFFGGILTGYGESVEDVAGQLQKARGAFENLTAE